MAVTIETHKSPATVTINTGETKTNGRWGAKLAVASSFLLALFGILSSVTTSGMLSEADGTGGGDFANGFVLPSVLSSLSASWTERRTQDRQPHKPLNVVLFYADDWTMNALGKLDPYIRTPHLDQMADNGMLFMSNFVTTSVCMTSRATLMTGVYAAVHNQTRIYWQEMYRNLPWNETFFPLMKSNSYYTGLVGKWHLSSPKKEMDMAFDVRNFYYGKHWYHRGGEWHHITDLNREDALKFLRNRPMDKNFLLKVSFFATHAWDGAYPSYQPKNSTLNEYYINPNVTIPRPKTATEEHWEQLPHFFTERNVGRARWRRRFDPPYFQESIRGLYSMATEVDAAVGAIIEELKVQGVYNETMLIFTTDNGNLHGQHGLAEKWYPFEESIMVPLIIQDPRMPPNRRGTVSKDFTLSIDLAPTILGAANIEARPFMQGDDIAKLYLDDTPPSSWRKDFFYEYNRGNHTTGEGHDGTGSCDNSFALVSPDWKYVYWPEQDYEQIFHRSMDPYDEYDLLHRNLTTAIQPTDEIYKVLKARYSYLKNLAQSGARV